MTRYSRNDDGGFIGLIMTVFCWLMFLRFIAYGMSGVTGLPIQERVEVITALKSVAREEKFNQKLMNAALPVEHWTGCNNGEAEHVIEEWRELYGRLTAPDLDEWNSQHNDYLCWKRIANHLDDRTQYSKTANGEGIRYTKCRQMFDRSLCTAVESQLLYPTPRGCVEMFGVFRWKHATCIGGEDYAATVSPDTFRKITVEDCHEQVVDAIVDITTESFIGGALCWLAILVFTFLIVICIYRC